MTNLKTYLWKFNEESVDASGTVNEDFVVPDGETWIIKRFGGSSQVAQGEIELQCSDDAGETWDSPIEPGNTIVLCIHLATGDECEKKFMNDSFSVTGSGTDVIVRMVHKNNNSEAANEIVAYIEGEKF